MYVVPHTRQANMKMRHTMQDLVKAFLDEADLMFGVCNLPQYDTLEVPKGLANTT